MKFVGGFSLLLAVIGISFVAGFRAKSPLMLNTVRRRLRAARPLALKSSGTPGAYASIVRHVGRVTGQEYETPVQAISTDDGFAMALPYGPNTDCTIAERSSAATIAWRTRTSPRIGCGRVESPGAR